MIGHDAPRMQIVALPMEMQERILHMPGDVRMPKGTTAHTCIQPCLDALPFLSLALFLGERLQMRFELF